MSSLTSHVLTHIHKQNKLCGFGTMMTSLDYLISIYEDFITNVLCNSEKKIIKITKETLKINLINIDEVFIQLHWKKERSIIVLLYHQ